jgi:hypothetical protein
MSALYKDKHGLFVGPHGRAGGLEIGNDKELYRG